jgi:hypothetical protein
VKFIFDRRLTISDLDPATRQYLKRRLVMQNPAHREAERDGRHIQGECPRGNRLERIEGAMMWTSELLDMMVLDKRKAHERIQKHAVRRDVFETLDADGRSKSMRG